MRTTVAQIQRCKPGLRLPGNAEETLSVFAVVNQLQTLLLDLEKVLVPVQSAPPLTNVTSDCSVFVLQKVPALFAQEPPSPAQSRGGTGSSPIPESPQLEAQVSPIFGPVTVETRQRARRIVAVSRSDEQVGGSSGKPGSRPSGFLSE